MVTSFWGRKKKRIKEIENIVFLYMNFRLHLIIYLLIFEQVIAIGVNFDNQFPTLCLCKSHHQNQV